MKKIVWLYLALAFISIISYGQMLNMNFYQDDNALVFKFTHINEQAGNLGKGIFGQGPYRYTLIPYLPIFYLFGYNPLPYYALALIFIVISVYVVYIFFLNILEDKQKSALASLLYAAGYVGSDGLIRIFNSILTSLSIIFSCGTIGFYYKYFQKRHLSLYFLSLLSFFLAVNIGILRTHYLIFVVIAFEIIFFLINKYQSIKKFIYSILISTIRLIPFLWLFYENILLNLDSRSQQGIKLFQSLLKGDLYKSSSFFTSIGNMLLSNQIFPRIYSVLQSSLNLTLIPRNIIITLLLIMTILILHLYKNKLISLKFSAAILFLTSAILILSRKVFSYQNLLLNTNHTVSLFAGIFFYVTCFIFINLLPHKKLAILFLLWTTLNLVLYSAYLPTSPLASDDRYLTHSFLPLVGLLSLWSVDLSRKIKGKDFSAIILVSLWGLLNLYSALSWHSEIINHRSNPSKRFFSQLKNYYPTFPKSSVFYFYIPDKPYAHSYYDANFGVGQMPDETAVAWRYNMDRYDLTLVNSFYDLKKLISEKNIQLDHIFTFIANPNNLTDTTQKTRALLEHGSLNENQLNLYSNTRLNSNSSKTSFIIEPIHINVNGTESLTDLKLTLGLRAEPLQKDKLFFPLEKNGIDKYFSKEILAQALGYKKWHKFFLENIKISASDFWKDNGVNLAIDNNPQTYWQGDRLKWSVHNSSIYMDLGHSIPLAGIMYKNGPSSLAPTKFDVLTSVDGSNFQRVTQVSRTYTDQESYSKTQRIIFDKIDARYVKLKFTETASDDSPAISQIEFIPEQFRNINQQEVDDFLISPYDGVASLEYWKTLLSSFENIGFVKVEWKTDGSDKFRSSVDSNFALSYDNQIHNIEINIPGEGQNLKELIITPLTIPGNLALEYTKYQNVSLYK